MDGNPQDIIRQQLSLDDEERILQIDLVLEGIPLVGELAIGEDREAARLGRSRFVTFIRQYSKFCPSGTK